MTLVKIYNLEATEEVDVVCSLSEGEHVIGRGGILNCNDKRISRKHALINVGKDVVTIKAVHINPCFFKAVNGNSITILPKDTSVVLNDGDRFALLADVFWFRAKIIRNDGNGQCLEILENNLENSTTNGNSLTYKSQQTIADVPSTSKRCHDENSTVNAKRTKISEINNPKSNMSDTDVISDETTSISPISPSNLNVLDVENSTSNNILQENLGANIDPNKLIDNLKNILEEDYGSKKETPDKKQKAESDDKSDSSGLNAASNSTEVKVKQEASNENVEIKQEKVSDLEVANNEFDKGERSDSNTANSNNIKTERTKESTSPINMNDNPSETNKNNPSCSTSDQKPKKTRRERCWYGPSCYRKNPIHRQDFSHPGDDDYNSDPEDDRLQCPFGTTCYRKNLDHRRQFKHSNPPATKPSGDDGTPSRRRKSPKKKQKTDDSSQDSSQDTSQNDDDGTTKRKRQAAKKIKTYNYDGPDDYDIEDPFIDNASSDDFELSTDDGEESEWDDSQEVDEESQETRRLLKEAKRFTKGKGKKKDS